MICSLWKIEFIVTTGPRAGEVIVLLDYTDRCEKEPEIGAQQANAASAAIFLPFGSNYALGGMQTPASWSRYRKFRTNHAARSASLYEELNFPWGAQGTMRVAISGGLTIEYTRSVLLAMVPSYPLIAQFGASLIVYRAQLGKGTVTAGDLGDLYLPVSPYRLWEEETFVWNDSGSWNDNILL